MRPSILFPLFAETATLPGVGPKLAKLIARVAGTRLLDLVFDMPIGVIDRSYCPKVADAQEGRVATMEVVVRDHLPSRNPRWPYKVRCADETGFIDIVFFRTKGDYLTRLLPVGATRVISGRVERFRDGLQMAHPDFIDKLDKHGETLSHEPVYGLTEGLSNKMLSKAVRGALDAVAEFPEWLDSKFQRCRAWPAFRAALLTVHSPHSEAGLSKETAARMRLAYDELLANQLALELIRSRLRTKKGRVLKGPGLLQAKALAALPFRLTQSQLQAIAEIRADMASPSRMLRLLQGDVGSGKTVVAFAALLGAVECGAQGALMAPTEILARQHLATLQPLAKAAGINIAILSGRERGAARQQTLKALQSGLIHILVGTHALFSEDVAFRDLAVAVVDEQHRFGVHHRMKLQGKGKKPVDVLVMTATPIPRTLALTAYGDMDVSRLTEKPAGRKPVDTRALSIERLDEVIAHLRGALSKGARAYWVCPLVEELEKSDLAAAQGRAAMLQEALGVQVGLAHGRMKGVDRDAAMAAFKSGGTRVLVATTVIEVGVDVPEATIMVVEHAERFGLAQLHQLRGRVGRGAARSTCLLLYQPPLGDAAKARLQMLRSTEDGFLIAEEDLRLRGPGEVLGVRQSGLPEFRLADLAVHGDLLACARDDARLIISTDPELKSARGDALRVLLYLFERDEAVRLLRAG